MHYSYLLSALSQIEEQRKYYQNELDTLPAGNLISTKDGAYSKWYVKDDSSTHYLPKSNRSYAEQLAQKKYLTLKLKELNQEYTHISRCLSHFPKRNSENLTPSDQLFYDSRYSDLLCSSFTPSSKAARDWISEPFDQNPKYANQLSHKSFSGNMVRSKSESLIDTGLFLNHIPFRYECALVLDDIIFYPDFTILHPVTSEIYYWEHFGLIDNVAYANNAFSKLQLYLAHDIVPDIRLITTFETQSHPLTADHVSKVIHTYFAI